VAGADVRHRALFCGNWILLFVAVVFPLVAAGSPECRPIAYVDSEFESAHVSIGRLKAAYPVYNLDVGAGADFGEYGYLMATTWTESDLTNHYRDRRHQLMQEVDPLVLYGYRMVFAEGWSLDSRLGAQWNLMVGSYGSARRSYDEWQFRETLETPYVTLWYRMRNFYLPVTKASFNAGVMRSFPLSGRLSLVPMFRIDGGSDRWNEQRFGYTDGRGRIGRGINSCSLKLRLDFRLSDNAVLYCGVMGYVAVDDDVRAELDADPSREAKNECAIVSTGLKFDL
jgi:hypothetical protein